MLRYPLLTCALLTLLSAAPVSAQSVFPQEALRTSTLWGASPNDARLADLDGDGFLEALAANTYGDFGILRGLGPKGFGALTAIPMPQNQFGIDTGDLDNDGILDVVVSGFGATAPGQLSIVKGLGGGALAPPVQYGLESKTFHVAVTDFDLDGNLDVLVPLVDLARVNVRLGDGAGGFLTSVNYVSETLPFRLAIADMNQDGKPDVLTASTGSWVSIQANDGAGGLLPPTSYPTPIKCYSVATGDFNLDGALDVVTANYVLGPANAVSVYPGTGTGTLGTPVLYPGPRFCNLVKVRDFNLDGKLDILALGYFYDVHSVYLGDGQGGFPQTKSFYALRHTGGDVGDMNLDGLLDIAIPDYFRDALRLRNGKPQGVFGEDIADTGARSLALADVNLDGTLDAVVGHVNGSLGLRAGTGAGFNPSYASYAIAPLELTQIRTPDLNADGVADLLVVASGGPVAYSKNTGLGTYPVFQTLPGTSDPRAAATGDVNLDGKLDVVVANYGFNTISIHRADASGGFLAPTHILSGGSGALAVELRDLNADGDPELVVVNTLSQVVGVALGQHHAAFGPFNNYLCLPGLTVAVAVEDLNQDGFADIVTSNDAFYSVNVRLNNGQAQFNPPVNVATAGSHLIVTDVNGDGLRDLLSNQGGDLNLALGDGTGALTVGPTFDLNPGNLDFAVGDLDSDGRIDVVSANGNGTQPSGASSGTLTILRSLVDAAAGTATYGAGTHGCLANLGMAASGAPHVNTPAFKLLTTNAPPLAAGLGLVGTVQDAFGTDYFGLGFLLHVNPFLSTELLAFDFSSDAAGAAVASAPIPNSPVLAGAVYFAQSIWLVPGCPSLASDLASSRALAITILP